MTIRKDKPNSAEETARVLRIYSMLYSEVLPASMPLVLFDADTNSFTAHPLAVTLLEIADSIARRTDDD